MPPNIEDQKNTSRAYCVHPGRSTRRQRHRHVASSEFEPLARDALLGDHRIVDETQQRRLDLAHSGDDHGDGEERERRRAYKEEHRRVQEYHEGSVDDHTRKGKGTEQHQTVADVERDEVHDDDDRTDDRERHITVRRATGVRKGKCHIDNLHLERGVERQHHIVPAAAVVCDKHDDRGDGG